MNRRLPLWLALLLGACSFTPEYQRPIAPIAAAWPNGMAAKQGDGVRPETARLGSWQAYFPDARLRELIAVALEHNRDLRSAVARVEEARALYGIVRADRLPNVDLVTDRGAAKTPGDLSTTGSKYTAQRYDVNLGVTSFELDFWGRVASLNEAAKASYLATEQAQRAFRLSLVADVANAYLTLLEMEERSALARTTLETRSEYRKLTDKRRDVGIAGNLDYLTADGAYQSALADLATLERQRAAAANALTLLVGKPLAEPVGGGKLVDEDIVAVPAAGLPSELLLQRPDILSAEQKLIAANATIGAARAAFLPRISLTGAFGTASKALAGLFEAGSTAWTFTPTLRQPIFDFGRSQANLDLAETRKIIAVADYEKAIQQAFREVADLLTAREQLARQLAAQQAAEKTQAERLKIVEARYQAGISSYLEVLDAQRDLYAVQQGVVQTRRAWLASAAQLYKALSVSE